MFTKSTVLHSWPGRCTTLALITLLTGCAAGSDKGASMLTYRVLKNLDHAEIETTMVSVEQDGTTIELKGKVASEADRERLWHIARETKGVAHVVDSLQVGDNIEVAHQVKAVLANTPELASFDLSVVPEDTRLTLCGTVETWSQAQLATELAMQTAPKLQIIDSLTVLDSSESHLLEEQVSEAMQKLEKSTTDSVMYSIKNRTVTLTGRVPHRKNAREIVSTLLGLPAVKRVKNLLKVDTN